LARLLLAAILIDTVNLKPEFGRAQPKDIDTTKKLLPFANIDQTKFFDDLQHAKFDNSQLSANDLLRKDYKEWITDNGIKYGVSSVLLSIEKWVSRDHSTFVDNLGQYYNQQSLHLLCIMHAYTDENNKFQRELDLYSKDNKLIEHCVEALLKSDLELVPITTEHTKTLITNAVALRFFHQKNIKSSRKQVQPLLHDILNNRSKH